ncbi:MAG: CARDB domain-containing protein [Chloroflexota bacterium]
MQKKFIITLLFVLSVLSVMPMSVLAGSGSGGGTTPASCLYQGQQYSHNQLSYQNPIYSLQGHLKTVEVHRCINGNWVYLYTQHSREIDIPYPGFESPHPDLTCEIVVTSPQDAPTEFMFEYRVTNQSNNYDPAVYITIGHTYYGPGGTSAVYQTGKTTNPFQPNETQVYHTNYSLTQLNSDGAYYIANMDSDFHQQVYETNEANNTCTLGYR